MIPPGITSIDVDDLKGISNYSLLDTREKEEFDISHISDAIWTGYRTFDPEKIDGLNKNETVIVYCSVGWRSARIAEKLMAGNYKKVYNLYGGIFEWVNRGNKVYDANGVTNNVHVFSNLWRIWVHGCNKII